MRGGLRRTNVVKVTGRSASELHPYCPSSTAINFPNVWGGVLRLQYTLAQLKGGAGQAEGWHTNLNDGVRPRASPPLTEIKASCASFL
jgi:hypothetical protein